MLTGENKMNIEECPVNFISLHTKIQRAVKEGFLTRKTIYNPGLGTGTVAEFEGRKVTYLRRLRGKPNFKNGVPEGLVFKDFHDVIVDDKTNTLLLWAPSL